MRVLALMAAAAIVIVLATRPGAVAEGRPAPALPEAAAQWIGPAQSWAALRGRVVVLDVWTFG